MPKVKKGKHAPLGAVIIADRTARPTMRSKARIARKEEEAEIDEFVNPKMSKKILNQAREQQHDEMKDLDDMEDDGPEDYQQKDDDSEEEDDLAGDGADEGEVFQGELAEYERHLNIAPEDEAALQMFMSKEPSKRLNLGELIMSKIKEKETEMASAMSDVAPRRALDDKVVRVFESVGEILTKYRSGKLPKAFKIIPTLKNWEEILLLTKPDRWSAAAIFQGTKIFTASLNARMAQRFFNLALLPRMRDDIAEYKRLNFHLFMALKKALFKPAAFFKGILIPLCEAGDCSLREAVIVCSVLARSSIPVLHSAAALLKIAELPYTGANSIFLRVMLDKKYALPYRVVDALVFHFLRFEGEKRALPVLWHQALLVFVQRYREDISCEQKDALMALLRSQSHPAITPDIRRELVQSRSRDSEAIYGGDE
eukprot:m.32395 g.32395  ORF g.32395 m.32395 type:complete len:427 (+) comp9390_c1_seq2:266-1546(+)